MCVFEQLCRRAVDEDFRIRRAPQHLVEDVVRAVGHVGDAVAVQVEGAVVAPVVAVPVKRPFDEAGADVHDLGLVANVGVVVDAAVRRAGGGMHADGAVTEMVVVEAVLVGVVEEDAFVGAVDAVTADFRVVDGVEHEAVFAAVVAFVIAHGDAVRKHDDVGGFEVGEVVVFHFTVFGVHVVDAEADAADGVVFKEVVFAVGDVDAVAPAADGVVADDGVQAFPELDAVAPVIDAACCLAGDGVVLDDAFFRPPDVDAEEVVASVVVMNADVVRGTVGKDAGVHVEEVAAGVLHGEVLNGASPSFWYFSVPQRSLVY